MIPHDLTESLVNCINRLSTLYGEEFVNTLLNGLLGSIELRCRSVCLRFGELV